MTLVHPVSFESNTTENDVQNTTENTTTENVIEAPLPWTEELAREPGGNRPRPARA